MILYALNCSAGHGFDSWFQSATALDSLLAAGHLSCPVCGLASVGKALMAPTVQPTRIPAGTLRAPSTDQQTTLAALRAEVEAKSEYVGMNFVAQARAMHEGEVPERSIYGEARPEEAIKLLQDGVPVAPLPFMPARKLN